MGKTEILGHDWNIAGLWNDALGCIPERPLEKREHIWASELGGSFIDRYLKMHATPYSNPPNERSKRKFVAGHFYEWIAGMVFTMIGILKARQLRGEVELAGLLRVSGKLDFIAGGLVDWDAAKEKIEIWQRVFASSIDEMPPFVLHAINYIFDKMQKQFGANPLKEVVFEGKSVSSFMFTKIETTKTPMPHNVLQCGHYLLANKMHEGYLWYVCKDDCCSSQFSVPNNKALLGYYTTDVAQMTEYFRGSNHKSPMKTLPPKEPEVLFDAEVFRFEKNFKVEYSNYLELLYGFKTPEDYRLKWAKNVSSWNRVFKRCVKGDKMTDMNKQVVRDVSKIFPQWDDYVYKAKSEGAFLTEKDLEEVE